MNYVLRLAPYLQDLSLCICKYSELLKNLISKMLLDPCTLDKGCPTSIKVW